MILIYLPKVAEKEEVRKIEKSLSEEEKEELKEELYRKKIAAGVDPEWARWEADNMIWHARSSDYARFTRKMQEADAKVWAKWKAILEKQGITKLEDIPPEIKKKIRKQLAKIWRPWENK